MATIVPNALPHSALDDIHLGNYVIPKVRFIASIFRLAWSYPNCYFTKLMMNGSIKASAVAPQQRNIDYFWKATLLHFFQGSTVFANILHVHYDPTYWLNPEEFKPERFIDPVTKLYKSDERLIPFSIGKRYCLGQSLAEKEYFLFFAGLLQRFDFESPSNQVLPRIGRDSGIILGLLRSAPFYDVIISKRLND